MAELLSSREVSPKDMFICNDCSEQIRGKDVISGTPLYVTHRDRGNPRKNLYRCENCQSDQFNNLL